jgi:monothiol glutaredoxin
MEIVCRWQSWWYTCARMPRSILEESAIAPAIRETISKSHSDIVDEVKAAVAAHPVVVVGMKQNPFPRRARKLLNEQKIEFHYLEYGSYLSSWRPRTALKMWTGWPTFPMIFVKGVLIGGAADLQKLVDNGELTKLLAGDGAAAK